MAEPRLISPMLDEFMMGSPISEHHGICCCPAMKNETDEKYIVKVISLPASKAQMDALLLSGAYADEESALRYFKELADDVVQEVDILEKMAEVEGFLPYSDCQVVPMESGKGYEIYLLSTYKRSLLKHFKRHSFTHLDALNLGLDLCAALSVCRRNGYLYVDLKPSNIFVTDQRLFRVGDLGFFRLDSLKYASIPEKYLSIYTPPEIRDAFSSLNPTMDTYAIGLILYQTYNNGELPFNDEIQPGDALPAPLYADYEMSEIILKACNPNPDERWQDPMQMGQAIISYMQRNGAADTPIVPMPTQEEIATLLQDIAPNVTEPEASDASAEAAAEEPETEEIVESLPEAEEIEQTVISEEFEISEEVVPGETPEEESGIADEAVETEENTDTADDTTEETEAVDEIAETITLLQEDADDAPTLEELEDAESNYYTITDEVSDMLNQADELAALDVPEPVVAPDYVDVELPEPEIEEIIDKENISDENTEDVADETDDSLDEEYFEDFDDEPYVDRPHKKHHWLRNGLIALAAVFLLVGGFLFYKNFYILPIEFITVEGNKDSLTVLVTTDIDESLLEVVCSDTYGNKIPAPVINGKAEFTGLVPNMAYNIKVVAKGFHRLTGSASTAYSTPIQTNIVQFDAVSGNTEDSVILSFTIKGPNCDEWMVNYVAEGEDVRTATFVDSHMVTLSGLTVGKEYTFTLNPKQTLYLAGQSEIKFTPRKLIRAENLVATGFTNNTLGVKWSASDGESVSGWSVRCHNDSYSQTLVTTDTFATFEGVDPTAEYEIEVKAAGMSVSEKITVPANSVTASNFRVDTADPAKLTVKWEPSEAISDDGWVLRYSVVDIGNDEIIPCDKNEAVITSVIPNATYRFQLEDTKGIVLLGSQVEVTTGNAMDFEQELSGVTIRKNDLSFAMCKTPERPNWGRYDLSDDDYTTQFPVGTPASLLMRFNNKGVYNSSQEITTMFVIRNQSGTPILTAQETKPWKDMWTSYNCKLEIPVLPSEAGTYAIEIYFNGGLAHAQEFTII